MTGSIVRLGVAIAVALFAAGCSTMNPVEPPPTTASDEAQYATLFPIYAEICALSQLGKKPGFGAEISSGFGGHAVLYLNGVCRRQDAGYPVLELCDKSETATRTDGVGLSVNAHYRNAVWVATGGRDFFFEGSLKPGQSLTATTYRQVQAEAAAKGIYAGVTFHDEVYDDMPGEFTRSSFQYEISVATDYAISFGRNRYCARVPLGRPQMVKVVDYLNRLNMPYRNGTEIFDWNVFTHNCSHINHNALAAANIWDEWEMDRFILVSLFDFPVPKNEFVNIMRRTNDFPIDDIEAVYADKAARALLLEDGRLPTQPGAIADLGTVIAQNDLYDTQSRIIFYDDPLLGSYAPRFDRLMSEPRYFRLRDNLVYFAMLYKKIGDERKPVEWHLSHRPGASQREQNDFRLFYQQYYDYINRQREEVGRNIRLLDASNR